MDGKPFHSRESHLSPAIRGPVMLIAIGALFALDYSAGVSFGKTWPILLIVAGLLHLSGRLGSGPAGVDRP